MTIELAELNRKKEIESIGEEINKQQDEEEKEERKEIDIRYFDISTSDEKPINETAQAILNKREKEFKTLKKNAPRIE